MLSAQVFSAKMSGRRVALALVTAILLAASAVVAAPNRADASADVATCWPSAITAGWGGVSVNVPAGCLSMSVEGSGYSIASQHGQFDWGVCYGRIDFADIRTGKNIYDTGWYTYYSSGSTNTNCPLSLYRNSFASRTVSSSANRTTALAIQNYKYTGKAAFAWVH